MYRSDADYPLIIKLLVGEDRNVRDITEELQYAVDCIHGHEESEPIANQPVQEEIEMSCGCILDEQSRPMHSCWAGLWLDDRRGDSIEGLVCWHDPAWNADEFVDHVKEIIAERGLD